MMPRPERHSAPHRVESGGDPQADQLAIGRSWTLGWKFACGVARYPKELRVERPH
jgi:hypothetical protein